jgi:predicted nuclease of predicted toxin-antitoxin system
MKLLLDENLSFRLAERLAAAFPGTTQVRLANLEREDDRAIWRYAKLNGFTIVTRDSDFHEICLVEGPPPKVIWLKCGNHPNTYIAGLLLQHKTEIAQFISGDNGVYLEIY